jgi:predicted ribosomally synthesized peptide with nif11-like leader
MLTGFGDGTTKKE